MEKNFRGGLRALGQGLGLGWGDEVEAWLRSKVANEGDYKKLLEQIQKEYGQYAEENPVLSGGLEFAGGAAPFVASLLVPGAQGASGLAATRSAGALSSLIKPLAKTIGVGAGTGAISGAGASKEGSRIDEAKSGALIGGALGLAVPGATSAGGASTRWLLEKLAKEEGKTSKVATEKIARALQKSGVEPKKIQEKITSDAKLGVPSTVANTTPVLSDLAESLAQRGGPGSEAIAEKLNSQKSNVRDRVYGQVRKGLKPGDYYDDEQRMIKELRSKAKDAYEKAYAFGEVDDPQLLEVLQNPQFKKFYDKAMDIANLEALSAKLKGEDVSRFQLKPIFSMDESGVPTLVANPDVRTLDYIKRGIDAIIDSGFSSDKSLSKAEAGALRDVKNLFVETIDKNVPDYQAARKIYSGDAEILDAMRSGLSDFGKLDHEQVLQKVSNMSPAEKDAFRTGVSRNLYSQIMDPGTNINAAQKLIGSPENQRKLQALFEKPEDFELFKAALTRESQLFSEAGKILGGSQTARRGELGKMLDSKQVGSVAADTVTGGFWGGLTGLVTRALRNNSLNDETSKKLAQMLMSDNPSEVAATVKLLEKYGQDAQNSVSRAGAANSSIITGVNASMQPAPKENYTGELEDPQFIEDEPEPEIDPELLKD